MITVRWVSKYQLSNGSWVFSPTEECLIEGRKLHKNLISRWKVPSYYYHLQKGGHVAALECHLNNEFFIHMDIKSFFNSVSRTRVIRAIKPYLGYKKAKQIADFSTVRLPDETDTKHFLPYGFAQSPILASICLHSSKLGKLLKQLSSTERMRLSVYVDDIILSSNSKSCLEHAFDQLTAAAASRFEFNNTKTEGPATEVTAFNVDLSYQHMTINAKRYSAFQKIYFEAIPESRVRQGIYSYVASIDKEQANKLGSLVLS